MSSGPLLRDAKNDLKNQIEKTVERNHYGTEKIIFDPAPDGLHSIIECYDSRDQLGAAIDEKLKRLFE